jgi:FixJ family two-component response regulator
LTAAFSPPNARLPYPPAIFSHEIRIDETTLIFQTSEQEHASMYRMESLSDEPKVFVVDPDPSTALVTKETLEGSNLQCEVFRSGRDFLAAYDDSQPGCLVLELRIPDMSGLQLQHRLSARGSDLPLVFLTADTNVSTAVELMRGGAVHVLEKPARPIELLSAIQEAIDLDQHRRNVKQHHSRLRDLTAALTSKERQVLELIGRGKSIKAIAAELELSVRAIELRRQSLMNKLGAASSSELMRFSVMVQREFDPRPDAARCYPVDGRESASSWTARNKSYFEPEVVEARIAV